MWTDQDIRRVDFCVAIKMEAPVRRNNNINRNGNENGNRNGS